MAGAALSQAIQRKIKRNKHEEQREKKGENEKKRKKEKESARERERDAWWNSSFVRAKVSLVEHDL